MTEKTYKIGNAKLTLRFGDITTTDTHVIVSSADHYLSMSGGVSAAILKAGGNEIALDAAKKVPANLGDVVITTAGRLKSRFVFHVVTIGNNTSDSKPGDIIKASTKKCLQLMAPLGNNSISFPAIGAGFAGFSYNEVALEMAREISDYLVASKETLDVTIYLYEQWGPLLPADYIVFFEAFAANAPQIAKQEISAPEKDSGIISNFIESVADTAQEIKSKRLHYLRKILGSLEDQRNRLEEKLIDQLENSDSSEFEKLKEKLKENEDLRLSRMKELRDLNEKQLNAPEKYTTPHIFVSSTYLDLVEHRKAIKEQISRRKMIFCGMEHFGANPDSQPPAQLIIEEVKKADVYIGVFGVRYGIIDQATGLSMTELEYREAKSGAKPMLLYVMKDTAQVKISDIEQDNTGREKLKELKSDILKNKVVYLFDTVADLERQVYEDLEKIK